MRESYFEYIPFKIYYFMTKLIIINNRKEHTIIEYTPIQKIEYIP